MAVRITHTNNSQGHDGTYVYRSTSPMDPQALPAPLADEPPVSLGDTFEYIDSSVGQEDYYYRTQDHEGGQSSTVSDEVLISLAEPAPAIGEAFNGGYYAGTITYADARQFHIIVADVEADEAPDATNVWGARGTVTGATDVDDGLANQDIIVSRGEVTDTAFDNSVNYAGGGYTDWYLPSANELQLLWDNLSIPGGTTAPLFESGGAQAFAESGFPRYWASTELNSNSGRTIQFYTDGSETSRSKDDAQYCRSRPVRRVPV